MNPADIVRLTADQEISRGKAMELLQPHLLYWRSGTPAVSAKEEARLDEMLQNENINYRMSLMDRSELFGSFEFDPEQSIPSDVPRPWYVAGYSFKAVDSVLRVDYLAQRIRHSRSVYEVPGGQITYIGHPEELRGTPLGVGTLHILWPPGHDGGTTLGRIIEEAHQRGIKMRDLPSVKREPAQ